MTKRNEQSSAPIDAAINRIASDNASGAAQILRSAGAVFSLLTSQSHEQYAGDVERARKAVIETCAALAFAQPDMSPLLRLAGDALSAARTATGARQSLEAARDAALSFIANAERAAQDAALRAAELIGDGATVLTHSRSSTVLAALVEAKRRGRAFSVVATESRPMLEGRALAEALARQGIKVTLIADAAASLAMNQVDLVMVGADKVTPDNVVNKIGTQMLALAARERSLPAYVICDTSKFIRRNYFGQAIRGAGDPSELWKDAPKGIALANSYFESTPLALFAAVITEAGALLPTDARRRAEQAAIDDALVYAIATARDGIKGPP